MELRVTHLTREKDWELCRERLDALAELAEPNPWATWYNWHTLWRLEHCGQPCLLIECVSDNGAAVHGATIWYEKTSRRRYGSIHVLRTLDKIPTRTPPLLAESATRTDVYETFTRGLKKLRAETGAHLLSQYYLEEGDALSEWVAALEGAGCRVRRRVLTQSAQITRECDLDALITSHEKKRVRELGRCERKMQREYGEDVSWRRARGGRDDESGVVDMWRAYKTEVWPRTWQYAYLQKQDAAARENNLAYLDSIITRAADNGSLDVSLLFLGTRPIAGCVGFVYGTTLWLMSASFDGEFRKYSPGLILYRNVILDSQSRGDELIDFGGESFDWKQQWAERRTPLYQIEAGLGGFHGLLWRLRAWLDAVRGKEASPALHDVQSFADFRETHKE